MENMPNLPPGTTLGLEQIPGENFHFHIKPIADTGSDGPVGPSGEAVQSNVWVTVRGTATQIRFGTGYMTPSIWYNPEVDFPVMRSSAETYPGWQALWIWFGDSSGPPPAVKAGRLKWRAADGTFFTDTANLLQLGSHNAFIWYPPTDTTYGSLEEAPGGGSCLGFTQIMDMDFGYYYPAIVPGGQPAAVTLDVTMKTYGDEAYYDLPPLDNLDWVHGTRVWSLDESTGKLTAHWKFTPPDFFTTDTFWVWPPGQSDPFYHDQAMITNDINAVVNDATGEHRIPVNLYFFPDPSIQWTPDARYAILCTEYFI
ncbi:hypothetical protein FRB99_002262 [Tulasnella sp. 403]|nr:hypothetical protein FRB99_002262 [Tulasnella sp. 403]